MRRVNYLRAQPCLASLSQERTTIHAYFSHAIIRYAKPRDYRALLLKGSTYVNVRYRMMNNRAGRCRARTAQELVLPPLVGCNLCDCTRLTAPSSNSRRHSRRQQI
jgi:hypothetical protein